MQVFGYALVDVLLIGCFLLLIGLSRRSQKLKIDVVFIFCVYMVIQALRGMYVLGDFRMIYWVLFFIILFMELTMVPSAKTASRPNTNARVIP